MGNKLLIIDNYDSFTYNLVQMIEQCNVRDYVIVKNDKIKLSDANVFDSFLFSPGPGIPSEAGLMCNLINHFASEKKFLGICLGHQAIAECFGAKLIQLNKVTHGESCNTFQLENEKDPIFNKLPSSFITGRYHSWIVSPENFPKDLLITAIDKTQQIMAIKHKYLKIHGVQFHPESYITQHGIIILENWLSE